MALRLRLAAVCAVAALDCVDTGHSPVAAAEGQSSERLEEQCAKRIRDGSGEWIECQASFGADEEGRLLLEANTAGLLQDALCSGPIRVQRKALVNAMKSDGDLQMGEHHLQCDLVTGMAQTYAVTLTFAPIVAFRGGSVADIRIGLKALQPLPQFLTVPVAELLDTDIVRQKFARHLDALLQRAFPEGPR